MTRSVPRLSQGLCILLFTGVVLASGAALAHAQRGIGDFTGVSGTSPSIVTLTGTVTDVKKGPCEQTTGRSPSAVHLRLRTADGPMDLHLGPTAALSELRDVVASGTEVAVKAFHSEALPSGTYVAVRMTIGKKAYPLRDPMTLRPRWSANRTGPRGGSGTGPQWYYNRRPRWRYHGDWHQHGGHYGRHHRGHRRPHHRRGRTDRAGGS
jgi:hypothetical protein